MPRLNFWQLTIKRLKSESPKYFLRLRRFCIWWVGAASACLVANTTLALPTPAKVVELIGYSIVAATFLGFGASLTTTDEKLKGMQ